MTTSEMKKKLEDYGYVFSGIQGITNNWMNWMPVFRILKSPRNDHNNLEIGYADMPQMIEDEEEIIRKRRSERIENILGRANK